VATRNLFRFVSVRPPIPAAADDPCRLINAETGAQFVADVMAWQEKYEESLYAARRAVSVEFIESAEYFARNDTWNDLRPELKRFQDLIAQICRKSKEPDGEVDIGEAPDTEEEPAAAAPAAVDSTFSQEAQRWVNDGYRSFGYAENALWRSYYANALAPELTPTIARKCSIGSACWPLLSGSSRHRVANGSTTRTVAPASNG
jgi:hypothetical protein